MILPAKLILIITEYTGRCFVPSYKHEAIARRLSNIVPTNEINLSNPAFIRSITSQTIL